MTKAIQTLFMIGLLCSTQSFAAPQSLEEIEALKTDIIQLNSDFKQLEQDYLYPKSVDAALFVSMDTGQFFTLQNIEIRMDGKPVAGHFYTQEQQAALSKGGIQRLQNLQLKPGNYELVITVIGTDHTGQEIKRGLTYSLEKSQKSLGVELQIKDNADSLAVELNIKEWQL